MGLLFSMKIASMDAAGSSKSAQEGNKKGILVVKSLKCIKLQMCRSWVDPSRIFLGKKSSVDRECAAASVIWGRILLLADFSGIKPGIARIPIDPLGLIGLMEGDFAPREIPGIWGFAGIFWEVLLLGIPCGDCLG